MMAGGARVELAYEITTSPLDGGSGISIDLLRIQYNFLIHQTGTGLKRGCAKHEIALTYGNASDTPLSMSILGDKVLVRKRTLTLVDVNSRPTCDTPYERLRRYELQYVPDTDTELPRLQTVRMFGRQGTPEEHTALPIASYGYGSATQDGKLRYERTQTIPLPAGGVSYLQIAGTEQDSSVNAPVAGERYAMWQTLTDVTGDGRPDLVFKKNDKLWVAYNRPGPNGSTTLGVGPQGIAPLSDPTVNGGATVNGGFSTHTTVKPRFNYSSLISNRNTTDVWRQAIDVNGDGRIDIIDAAEKPDHWVVYLNTPGPTGVTWERREFSVLSLRAELASYGHVIDGPFVPLSRRATGTNMQIHECWHWHQIGPHHWDWDWCGGIDPAIIQRGPERTFTEWELSDLNGDGYPDFIFNSSPTNIQGKKPPPLTAGGEDWRTGDYWRFFAPHPENEVRASFNVVGVRFDTTQDPFSRSVNLHVEAPEWGVSEWGCDFYSSYLRQIDTTCDASKQRQNVGFADVNGDGLVDRIVGKLAYLGTYSGTNPPAGLFETGSFSPVYITLPGPLATDENTHKAECEDAGGLKKPTATQTQGLRDLTGDGIPDYYDNGRVWIGTGTGFRQAIPITVPPHDNFVFSHETESCDGSKSYTDGGLFDIDGDGRPDIVGLVGNTFVVSQLVGGQAVGRPEAGRLTEIDNGYGAKTSITYVSAKRFTDNPVPFPEIVVSAVATTGTQHLGGTLAGTRYAYDKAELIFDSALDRFSFPGYGRVVELRLTGGENDPNDPTPIAGQATITDTWPLTPFTSTLTKPERWLRRQRVGRVRDVLTLRGSATTDPWSLLDVSTSDARLIGGTHYEWDAKLYEVSLDPAENLFDCMEMFFPLDYARSVAHNIGAQGIDACRAHGFALAVSEDTWHGDAPPPSGDNIQTRSRVLAVDDFGHSTLIEYDNDLYRSDDDICVESRFATPNTAFPRVLSALSSRRFFVCGGQDITLASESFIYDGLSAGSVSNGWVTSRDVDRRATDTGALLNTVHRFDAMYDATGKLTSIHTQRNGAARTVTFDYDSFGLVPTRTKREATGVPPVAAGIEYDLVSLEPVRSTDFNQTKRGIDLDGFGRLIRATITPSGGSLGVVSTRRYLGFAGADVEGRRIEVKSFGDPVAPANVATAVGRTGTVFLDELDRTRRSELALGSDYANEVLVVGSRVYDEAGRVVFEADPFPKSQNSATAYGTSYHFKDTGDLNCVIRGRGRQPLNMVTDLATERLPTCLQRSFAGHVDTLDVRDAASLEPSSPQSGVVKRRIATAIGRVIERAAFKGGLWLEFATFAYDRLGQLTTMVRFGDPAGLTNDVQWSSQVDSLGEIMQSAEPDIATRSFSYSDWGEPIEARWLDGGIERRLVRRYDALGRLTATEEHNDGVTDPETINTYAYDTGVTVSPLVTPTFVLGQLARATSPSGQVTFSYDAFGRKNAQVFTDNEGGLYIQKTTHRADGRLIALEFNLPDQNHQKELVKYTYDSAGRLRGMTYVDASAGREIYRAENIDPFGRVRKAIMGGHVDFLADYANEGRRLMRSASVESPTGTRRVMFEHFDPVGRELSRREIKDGTTTETKITYEALGRLRDVMKVDGGTLPEWAYSYDALGNLFALRDFIGSAGATLSYRTDDRDRVCRIGYGPGGLGGTMCNVTYDGLGNTIEQATRTGVRRLEYFASGNVRRITEGTAQASFRYDPLGVVQELDVTGTGVSDIRRDRRYGGLIERRDLVADGTPKTFIFRHIPGPGGIIATRRGATQDWIFGFGELRGNRFFANQDGTYVQEVKYEPFGEAKSSGASPGTADYTSYQWNGGDALAAFTLSHLGARLYDPVIGRFLSRDPLTVSGTATTSNPYAFAANDPFNGADPSGLDCIGIEGWCPSENLLWSGAIALATSFHAIAGPSSSYHRAPRSLSELYENIVKFRVYAFENDVPIPTGFNLERALRYTEDWASLLDDISRQQDSVDAYNRTIERMKGEARSGGLTVAASALAVAASVLAVGAEVGAGLEYLGLTRGIPGLQGLSRFLGWRALGGRAAAGAALGAREQIANELEELPPPASGVRIGLGLDKDLSKLKGAVTYEEGGWAKAGLTGPYDAGNRSSFERAFKESSENASEIYFELSNFSVQRPKQFSIQYTESELLHIMENEDLLLKTTFFRHGSAFGWNGRGWVDLP